MQALREFLASPTGRIVGGVFLVACIGMAVYSAYSTVSADAATLMSTQRMYMDSKTGQPFPHTLTAGDATPIDAPSGGKTGYPAEACFWTKDGKIKTDPTWVLLEEYTKAATTPTFCPDCTHRVVGLNPQPGLDDKPPQTKEQYEARRGQR